MTPHDISLSSNVNPPRKVSTEIVEAMRVRARVVVFLDELEVVRGFIYDHSRVLPAAVNDVTQAVPRVLLHEKLRGNVLHFHHLCTVCDVIDRSHSEGCKTEGRNEPHQTRV